ncbi:hypothetical protein PZN02_002938 [Sinorhizobium garamanticum]|uniref:Uncharacterized protein n=1 Tax=Sinorhizobium garamanticum TaxID=680247 RepID=A0ABY8DC64_9HYPH|nr:hypothetical protein [Sinorhizobium garamanticum]WEX86636.1 hypothetical protein PZN02_002938 [Sinorhizobium garamanticum]
MLEIVLAVDRCAHTFFQRYLHRGWLGQRVPIQGQALAVECCYMQSTMYINAKRIFLLSILERALLKPV